MHIDELESYNLADAVKFHDRLNPRLWNQQEHLQPKVRNKLLEIAQDFQEFLGVPDLEIQDITVSGSNAAYNYTPHSDIDLHLVVDMPQARDSEVFRELFDAKKFQYNTEHDIRIGGYDVELYVQDSKQEHHSQGIYSLLNNKWVSVPRRRRPDVDDISVKSKYEDVGHRIESAIRSGNVSLMNDVWEKLRVMRKQGLEREGEFAPENLVFKMLRNNGTIGELKRARQALRDRELSLAEKARSKQKVSYGFANESPDGVDPTTKMFLEEPVEESPDGVNPSTAMFLTEVDAESVVQEFIRHTANRLGIENMPKVHVHHDPNWSEQNQSFGRYEPEHHALHVSLNNRHLLDVLRTTAHELCHCRQHEIESLPMAAGATGSDWENEAHAVAGIVMRDFADAHPEYFKMPAIEESASGYIPRNKREAQDPRYSMAVTVDIKPGQVGREANKLALNTGRNGEPGLLMKSVNLREHKMPQPSQGQGKYRDLNEPLGPEFRPTMPRGTVRVDVSDVYDWYKLGKHIPNLDRADASEFGKGPPSTIVSFGDEDTEHKYIKDLEKLGLTTTDIDPVDPDQPKGMKRQKVDPTYNVAENELEQKLAEEFALFEQQDLFEINMSPSSLARLAKDTNAQAGMEFEMVVPGMSDPDWLSGEDQEPDMDEDQRTRSFSEIEEFFNDGNYNSRREVQRVIEQLQEEWLEAIDAIAWDNWSSDEEEAVWDWVKENVSEDDAREELELPEDHEFTREDWNAFVEKCIEEENTTYEEAKEAYIENARDGLVGDGEYDWLRSNYPRMSSVQENFDGQLTWPYWTTPNDGEADIDAIADDFESAIGKPVNASRSYHGGRREAGHYVVEPDGSIDTDGEGAGLEFISPPMPVDEMLDDLDKVVKWAAKNGCSTNSSTGLHMNVSVPDLTEAKLDYVKLALLLGDEYVLEQFGRSANTYCKSALKIVRDRVRERPEDAAATLEKMKEHLEALASKVIHSGTTNKYTSINTKGNYIEFRSPGGDWLGEYAADPGKIKNTLLRFVVATDAAVNPDRYREEYLKKLYKLLEPTAAEGKGYAGKGTRDTVKYFADYVAGKTPRAALRSFVKQAQLERNLQRGPKGDVDYWWRVSNPAHSLAEIEVVATNREDAIEKALEPDGYPAWANTRQTIKAVPVRPYSKEPVRATVGEPEPIGQQSAPMLNGRPSNPDGNWVITQQSMTDAPDRVYYRFAAVGPDDAHTVLQQWRQRRPGQSWQVQHDERGRMGQPPVPGSTVDLQRQRAERAAEGSVQYEMFNRTTGQIYRTFYARDDEMGIEIGNRYRDEMTASSGTPRASIGLRRAGAASEPAAAVGGSQTDIENRLGWGDQTADANYEILDRRNHQRKFVFIANTPQEAQRKYQDWLAALGYPDDTEDFGYRAIGSGTATYTTSDPASSSGEFSGTWIIKVNGQEVHRLSGIGNNQGDANRIGRDWLLTAIRNGQYNPPPDGAEIEVVPEMR